MLLHRSSQIECGMMLYISTYSCKGTSIKDIRFFGPFFDLPTYPYPIYSHSKDCCRLAISDFCKPTYPKIGYPLWTPPNEKLKMCHLKLATKNECLKMSNLKRTIWNECLTAIKTDYLFLYFVNYFFNTFLTQFWPDSKT